MALLDLDLDLDLNLNSDLGWNLAQESVLAQESGSAQGLESVLHYYYHYYDYYLQPRPLRLGLTHLHFGRLPLRHLDHGAHLGQVCPFGHRGSATDG